MNIASPCCRLPEGFTPAKRKHIGTAETVCCQHGKVVAMIWSTALWCSMGPIITMNGHTNANGKSLYFGLFCPSHFRNVVS